MFKDRVGKSFGVGDILYTVKGVSMAYHKVVGIDDGNAVCQEIDINFEIIKQPRGKKFITIKPIDSFLHSTYDEEKDKYTKVL